mgnify:CR=1 FL=1
MDGQLWRAVFFLGAICHFQARCLFAGIPLAADAMGWPGSRDTRQQVRLSFDKRDDAIGYAEKHGLDYEVQASRNRSVRAKAYSDNFRANRQGNWTH